MRAARGKPRLPRTRTDRPRRGPWPRAGGATGTSERVPTRVNPSSDQSAPIDRRAAAGDAPTLAAVACLGLVIALAVRGHFAMPHPDFLEFADVGDALLHGRMPPTFKRGPVYPLLVAGIGAILPGEAPQRSAAEWINVAAYALSGMLVHLIARRWLGRGARWIAMASLLMPIGIYCAAHVIVEPLLAALLLATVWLAQRRASRAAYAIAAVACLTRFDASGLLAGLAVADVLRREPATLIARRVGFAAAPLALWLALTAWTWQTRSDDHYLRQIAESPVFAPGWALWIVGRAVGEPEALRLPGPLSALTPALSLGVTVLIWAGAAVGGVKLLRSRDTGGVVSLLALLAYVGVHAIFPFRPERFGYPPAAFLLLTAGVGWRSMIDWCRAARAGTQALRAAGVVAGLAVGLLLLREIDAVAEQLGLASVPAVTPLALLAAAMIWAAPRGRGRLTGLVALAACYVLIATQLRCAALLMGSGRDLANQVEAARWIRDRTAPTDRVLSACPGLLRLYAGREPPDRFEHFGRIEADDWADIVAECRARSIGYIVWHDQLWQEHGPYYSEKWRLSRFDRLAAPDPSDGVVAERYFARIPNLVIVRILPRAAQP